MRYNAEKKEIYSDKLINELDKFAIGFINILEKFTDYVIVSGYVSIVLGRTRASEDVGVLIPKMNFDKFYRLFDELNKNNFECLNSYDVKEAFEIWHQHAIRFSKERMPILNIEFKMITNKIQEDAFENKIKLILKDEVLYISPLELQVAYKLSLMAE